MEKPKLALRAWGKLGGIERVSPFGSGHINDTYLVEGANGRYILQRINTNTFQDVDGLMQNIRLVTEFITEQTRQAGGDVGRESMRVIPCDDGELYHRDEEGSCWRVLSYIEGSVCLQKARNEQDLFECAAAFGRFQRQLGDFDASRLTETIPRFHDTPKRYQDFERAVQQDTMDRAAKVQREIEFVRQRKADCRYLFDLQQRGELPPGGLPGAGGPAGRRKTAAAGHPQRHQAQQRPAGRTDDEGAVRHRPGYGDAGAVGARLWRHGPLWRQ